MQQIVCSVPDSDDSHRKMTEPAPWLRTSKSDMIAYFPQMPRCCVSVAASQGVGEMFSSCLHKHQLPSSLIDRESSQHPPLISVKPGNPSFPLFISSFVYLGEQVAPAASGEMKRGSRQP